MSTLRARCPHCTTLTAVALGDGYQCHACGAEFAAGLVRVFGAWGVGGEAMRDAAGIALSYPETLTVHAATLDEQTERVAADLPRPVVVLGGCCCSHLGAIRGLARRHGTLAVAWFDAHGDLNTPATSPSGNVWGMPLRMALDEGLVAPDNVALLGARNLDPPEQAYVAEHGIDDDVARATAGADAVYVALDVDVLAESELDVFMPEPGGLTNAGVVLELQRIAAQGLPVAGIGFTGCVPTTDPAQLTAFAVALGL